MFNSAAVKDNKLIRFVDTNYQDKFYIADGSEVRLSYPDGHRVTSPCRYIDAHHFYFGTRCFHIQEFAEMLAANRAFAEPRQFVTEPTCFAQRYLDRDLKNEQNKPIPYFEFFTAEDKNDVWGLPKLALAWCPDAPSDRQFCIATRSEDEKGRPCMAKTFVSGDAFLETLTDIINAQDLGFFVSALDMKFIKAFASDNYQPTKQPSLADQLAAVSSQQKTHAQQPEKKTGPSR